MKPNILLLHGALGTKAQLEPLAEKLTANFQVHTLDFAGHGDHASDAAFTMELFANNVMALLQSQQLTSVHIFGYSMGGYVALQLASKHPEFVGKIVTLATKFDWTPATAAKEIKMLNPEKIVEKVPAFAAQLAAKHTANSWQGVVNKTAQMMQDLGNGAGLSSAELTAIKHPVLINIGDEDRMVSVDESRASATALPNGQLQIMPGFQHPLEKADLDILSGVIVGFINH